MSNLNKKIELIANIAIIAVALLFGGILVKNYFFQPKRGPVSTEVPPGTKISLPDMDWSSKNQTVLIALAKGCDFCARSAPFYQRLAKEMSGRTDTKIIYVLPQSVDEAKGYLTGLNIPFEKAEVRQSTLDAVQVKATPTLLALNNEGVVTASWVGMLSPEKESEVINRLKGEGSDKGEPSKENASK